MKKRGVLITFEGGEGAGKSTQARLLAEYLEELGIPVLLVREPGGTALGEGLRGVILAGAGVDPLAEALVFLAARAELAVSVIEPALAAGKWVLCDRYVDSTLAYQGYGLGVDLDLLRQLNARVVRGAWPRLTFLLDLEPEQGLARTADGGDAVARRDMDFHRRVRQGYLALAEGEPRFRVLDAGLPLEEVSRRVRQAVGEFVPEAGVAAD